MSIDLQSSTLAVSNSVGTAPNPATDPSKGTEPSAPKAAAQPGSANNAGQRLQHILREADTTIAKYAAYAGVTLRPAHGPIGRSINANAVYNKLVADGAYDPKVAAEAQNFLTDMAGIGESAGMNFNLHTTPTADDPKGVPLNQGSTKVDPELVKAVQEMRRNEQATQQHGKGNSGAEPSPERGDGKQLWGNEQKGSTEKPHSIAKPGEQHNAALPTLVPNQTPGGGEPLW
jgi:hypothetical protein